jgi:hypothetical protein
MQYMQLLFIISSSFIYVNRECLQFMISLCNYKFFTTLYIESHILNIEYYILLENFQVDISANAARRRYI